MIGSSVLHSLHSIIKLFGGELTLGSEPTAAQHMLPVFFFVKNHVPTEGGSFSCSEAARADRLVNLSKELIYILLFLLFGGCLG